MRKSLQRTFHNWLVVLSTPLRITANSPETVAWATLDVTIFRVYYFVHLNKRSCWAWCKKKKKPLVDFAQTNSDSTHSLEAWLSWKDFYLGLIQDFGMLCFKDLRDLHWTFSISDEEPGAQRGSNFPKLHSKSVQSWAQSSGLTMPWLELLCELWVSAVQSWAFGIVAFVFPFH